MRGEGNPPTFGGGLRFSREVCMNVTAISFGVALALLASQVPAQFATYRPGPGDVIRPANLPEIGKWMVSPDLTPADWLGPSMRARPSGNPSTSSS